MGTLSSGCALVLGGGGPVGRAWQMGLAAGLLDAGIDFRRADLIVGTSAGAVVGARLALGIDPRSWDLSVDAAVDAAPAPGMGTGLQEMIAGMVRATTSATPELERAAIGRLALAADTVGEEASLARVTFDAFRGRAWPSTFRATAVAAHSGAFRAIGPADHVALERGVAASAALPIAWPPITIDGQPYVDGGVRSMLNADLAAEHSGVVVIACFTLDSPDDGPSFLHALNASQRAELNGLRTAGAAVALIEPTPEFRALTADGSRLLEPGLVAPGYALGRAAAKTYELSIRRAWPP